MKRTHVAALIAASLAMPAMAFEGPAAFTPSLVGASYPNTAIPATAWKLVGVLDASAVQIAPQWLITAEHVTNSPNVSIGYTFTNAYGSAVVDAIFKAPNAGGFPANVDLALVHLNSAIAVPTNELPLLLSDFIDTYNLPGQLLAAGRGGFGPVRAHWFPANENGGFAGVKGIVGDSGSGTFWYPTPTSRPVLRAVTSGGGNPLADQQPQTGTNPAAGAFDVRQWILGTIAGFGANAGPGPYWTTSTALAPVALRLPNAPYSARVNSTSASSAWVEWTAPKTVTTGVPDATSYVIRVSPGGMEYSAGVGARTLNINGLAANTTYTATVQIVNPNGPSGRTPLITALDDLVSTDRSKFATSTPPAAFAAFTYETYTTANSGTVKGCVRMLPTYASGGAPATSFGISNYASNLPTLKAISPSVDYCVLQPGISTTFFAAPWNHLSPGPAQTITVTPPPAVSGEPLNLTAKGLSIVEDGTPYYFLKMQWTRPNPPQPVATLNGYQVAIRCNTPEGRFFNNDFGLAASTTTWSVSGVPKGSACTVFLTANWSRTIPYNSAVVTASIPAQ